MIPPFKFIPLAEEMGLIGELGEWVLTEACRQMVELKSEGLELTEGMVMDHTNATLDALNQLKTLGVNLSIDDFGTGYSSLSYLSRFPLDELKIDRSFVIDFDKSDNDASLVIAIIAMGKSVNLKLVAEGVEIHEQYHFLTQNGTNIIQGYLFSKPVPAQELRPLLTPYHFLNQIQMITASQTREAE